MNFPLRRLNPKKFEAMFFLFFILTEFFAQGEGKERFKLVTSVSLGMVPD
jgi:hypothetical protein